MINNDLTRFKNLGLSNELLSAINELGYKEPTPIQKISIPIALMGRDILGSAQTGTGKTASFTLPMIDILASGKSKARMPRSLILTPTRELAQQISDTFEKFSKFHNLSLALLIGGVPFSEQDRKLNRGVDVLIATPGRLLDHFERGNILFNSVKILVIDEADRMLDMGFIPDIEKIHKVLPKIRQTLFFSATLSSQIRKIGERFVMNPKIIEVAPPSSTSKNIDQNLVMCEKKDKINILCKLLKNTKLDRVVIFCNRKKDIDSLSSSLKKNNLNSIILHGDMTQSSRNESLTLFKDGNMKTLIASDVAGRGLDIENISHVFNFDVPINAEDYVHRIGRTGRANNQGVAITLGTKDDFKYIKSIENLIGSKIKILPSPEKLNSDKKIVPSERKDLNIKQPIIQEYKTFMESDHIPAFLKR